MDVITETFGQYLRQLRKRQGLTLKELGKLTGFSYSYLSQLERGERGSQGPSQDILKKLSVSLDADFVDLMERAGHWNFNGLPDEKKEQLRESYEAHAKFVEEFREFLSILSENGEFIESVKPDIEELLKRYLLEEEYSATPKGVLQIAIDNKDWSYLGDLNAHIYGIAKKHNLVNLTIDPDRERKNEEEKEFDELRRKLSDLFIQRGILNRFDQDKYIEYFVGNKPFTRKSLYSLIRYLEMEVSETEFLDFNPGNKSDYTELLTVLSQQNLKYRNMPLNDSDRERILIMLAALFPVRSNLY